MTLPATLLDVPAIELEDDADDVEEYTPLIDERAAARDRLRFAARGHGSPSMRLAGRLLVASEAAAVEELRAMHERGEVDAKTRAEAHRWLHLAGCDGQMDWLAALRGEETER